MPVTRAPFENVAVNWKHRLDQAYVYVDWHGDYRGIGAAFQQLLTALDAQSIAPTGPMFALYFDDPGAVSIDKLQARACMPVDAQTTVRGGLRFDVLPSTTVAYALVAGPYAEVPRAYPGVLSFLRQRAWTIAGPIREIYVNPEAAAISGELLTEVQVPWRAATE